MYIANFSHKDTVAHFEFTDTWSTVVCELSADILPCNSTNYIFKCKLKNTTRCSDVNDDVNKIFNRSNLDYICFDTKSDTKLLNKKLNTFLSVYGSSGKIWLEIYLNNVSKIKKLITIQDTNGNNVYDLTSIDTIRWKT